MKHVAPVASGRGEILDIGRVGVCLQHTLFETVEIPMDDLLGGIYARIPEIQLC